MIASDALLLLSLAAFVVLWGWRSLSVRTPLLVLSALMALCVGLYGVLDDRWQAAAGVVVALLFLAMTVIGGRARRRRAALQWLSGGVALVLLAAAAVPILGFPVRDLPPPSGPYAVGVRTFELVDPARRGVLLADASQPRRLLVRVWYPAQSTAGLQPAPYFTDLEADTTAHGLGHFVGFPPLLSYLKHVDTNSYPGAPLLRGAHQQPTVVYSHGYLSFLGQNTALMEELASHGYVVYAVQHTRDASPTVFPDGDVVPTAPPDNAAGKSNGGGLLALLTGKTPGERLAGYLDALDTMQHNNARILVHSARIWVQDLAFLLDRLQQGRVPESVAAIVAASSPSRTGQIGMSFGGSAAGGFCSVDDRCAAGVNLDGLNLHVRALDADMPVPFLMLYADLDLLGRTMAGPATRPSGGFNLFAYSRLATAGSHHSLYRYQVKGARHMGFSDLSLFVRRPLGDGLLGTVPAQTMIAVQNDLVRAFLDRHLNGARNAFPSRQVAAYGGRLRAVDNSAVRDWWRSETPQRRRAIEQRIQAMKAALSAAH